MAHLRAEKLHLHSELAAACRLERLASRPLEPHRAELRALAARLRALSAYRRDRVLSRPRAPGAADQLTLAIGESA